MSPNAKVANGARLAYDEEDARTVEPIILPFGKVARQKVTVAEQSIAHDDLVKTIKPPTFPEVEYRFNMTYGWAVRPEVAGEGYDEEELPEVNSELESITKLHAKEAARYLQEVAPEHNILHDPPIPQIISLKSRMLKRISCREFATDLQTALNLQQHNLNINNVMMILPNGNKISLTQGSDLFRRVSGEMTKIQESGGTIDMVYDVQVDWKYVFENGWTPWIYRQQSQRRSDNTSL